MIQGPATLNENLVTGKNKNIRNAEIDMVVMDLVYIQTNKRII